MQFEEEEASDLGAQPAKRKTKERRKPKPATPERLEKAALAYLERYATSADNLRRVLSRRVMRSARLHGTEEEPLYAHIDQLIERYTNAGLLDDALFARSRAASLSRAGHASSAIRGRLRAKGVGQADIDQAIDTLRDDAPANPDLIAALRYARRRRLGPFGQGGAEARQKHLAALARRGFSLDLARLIIEAEDEDALADRLTDQGVDLYSL